VAVALESLTIKRLIEAASSEEEKPYSNEDDLMISDADFVKVDMDTLFDLILAAKDLNIKSLHELTCQASCSENDQGCLRPCLSTTNILKPHYPAHYL
jgi:hypothetical protein